jgi:hypothetical protein
MTSVDFSLMNALAAEIGENRVLEMAHAYIAYVEAKRGGISPPSFRQIWSEWGGQVSEPIPSGFLSVSSPITVNRSVGLRIRSSGNNSPQRVDFQEPYPRSYSSSHMNSPVDDTIIHSPRPLDTSYNAELYSGELARVPSSTDVKS